MLKVGHFGELLVEDVSLKLIAEKCGTPTYVYSLDQLGRKYDELEKAMGSRFKDSRIHYAIKANYNTSVVSHLISRGAGIDIVSTGEGVLAMQAGASPPDLIFSGVGKTAKELAWAVDVGVGCIYLESYEEMDLLKKILVMKAHPRVNVGLRFNPNVEAETHSKISTGAEYHKFGMASDTLVEAYTALASKCPRVHLNSISMHIGSQLYSLDGLRSAFVQLRRLAGILEEKGMDVRTFNLGGGLGISYGNPGEPQVISPDDYAQCILSVFGNDHTIILEPGRYLTAEAGVLITEVIRIKEGRLHDFIVVDAGMNDLMRPALYDAYHEIVPVIRRDNFHRLADVVGPVCETSDVLAHRRYIKTCYPGDFLVIKNTGAYGYVMATNYNGRRLPAEVIVKGGEYEAVKPRTEPDGGRLSRLVD